MSKTLIKHNFPSEYKQISQKLSVTERSYLFDNVYLTEVNTSGLSNKEIDEAVKNAGGVTGEGLPENGKLISDPTNKLLLIRQGGIWRKVKVE